MLEKKGPFGLNLVSYLSLVLTSLSVFCMVCGLAGMVLSFCFLCQSGMENIAAGVAGFVAGALLLGSGLVALTLVALNFLKSLSTSPIGHNQTR